MKFFDALGLGSLGVRSPSPSLSELTGWGSLGGSDFWACFPKHSVIPGIPAVLWLENEMFLAFSCIDRWLVSQDLILCRAVKCWSVRAYLQRSSVMFWTRRRRPSLAQGFATAVHGVGIEDWAWPKVSHLTGQWVEWSCRVSCRSKSHAYSAGLPQMSWCRALGWDEIKSQHDDHKFQLQVEMLLFSSVWKFWVALRRSPNDCE